MFGQRRSPWPNIETALGDCLVFALTAIRVTLYAPRGHYSDNMTHWPKCEIMLGHRLRRWANIIPTKTLQALNHEYNREYIYFLRLFKHESTQPMYLKRSIAHVHRDWCTEKSTVSHTQHPSFP